MQIKKFWLGVILLFNMSYFSNGQVVLKHHSSALSKYCFSITGDKQANVGAVWFDEKLDLSKPFSLKYIIQLGIKDASGGDGVAFVMHNDPLGYEATGESGQGLFFGDGNFSMGSKKISPSVAIEFDTYRNTNSSPPISDPVFDHTTVVYNGAVDYPQFPAIQIHPTKTNVEDATCFVAEIKWDPSSNSLSLYVDGSLRFTHTDDIVANVFNATKHVYFGFTGSTGGLSNSQTVCMFENNTVPTVRDDSYFFSLNSPVIAEVLENDLDSDGDEIFVSTILLHPANGSASISQNKTIIYTPAEGFIGKDSLRYRVSDLDSLFEEKCFTNTSDGWVFFNPPSCPDLTLQAEVVKDDDISCVTNLPNGRVKAVLSDNSFTTHFTFKWYRGALTLIETQEALPAFIGSEFDQLSKGMYTVVAVFKENPNCEILQHVAVSDNSYVPMFGLVSTHSDKCNSPNGRIDIIDLNFPLEDVVISWTKDGAAFENGKLSITDLPGGIYEAHIFHVLSSCKSVVQATIIDTTPAFTPIVSSVQNTSCDEANGSLTASINGAVEGFEFYLAKYGETAFKLSDNNGHFDTLTQGKYYLTAVNKLSGCSADTITVEIKSDLSFPLAPKGNSIISCGPVHTDITVEGVGETFKWYDQPIAGSVSFLGKKLSGYFDRDTSFYISAFNESGCESPRTKVSVKINPVPAAPNSQKHLTCGPSLLDVSFEKNGSNYHWYDQSTNGNLLFSGASLALTFSKDTVFYISSSNGSCESVNRAKVEVIVHSLSDASITQQGSSLIAPEGKLNYRWFLNETMLNYSSRIIEPVESGSYTVVADEENGCTVVSEPFQFAILSSEEEIFLPELIYPNPTSGILNLKLGINWDRSTFHLLDRVGKEAFGGKLSVTSKEDTFIDISTSTPGIYYIIIEKEGKRIVRTIVKE